MSLPSFAVSTTDHERRARAVQAQPLLQHGEPVRRRIFSCSAFSDGLAKQFTEPAVPGGLPWCTTGGHHNHFFRGERVVRGDDADADVDAKAGLPESDPAANK